MFYSRDYDEVFIKLKATEENLIQTAKFENYLLQHRRQPGEHFKFQDSAPYSQLPSSTFANTESSPLRFFKTFDDADNETGYGSLF